MSYKIGVDGGGSKTECILVDAVGKIVARQLAPGCNPSVAGPAGARTVVAGALRTLAEQSGVRDPKSEISATLLCMAGSAAFWQEFADDLKNFGRVISVDDSLPVLELATGGGPGLVLHAGTGSFVAARQQPVPPAAPAGVKHVAFNAPSDVASLFGEVHYAGGLGWRLGDPGSGYDLGRRAIARAVLELQGWIPPSGLGKLVCRSTGLSGHREIKRHFYSEETTLSTIAGLAPEVLRLAGDGDPAALAVAVDSTSELLNLALRVAAKIFPTTPLGLVRAGLSGRILLHPAIRQALAPMSGLILHPVEEAPIEGVRRLLAKI